MKKYSLIVIIVLGLTGFVIKKSTPNNTLRSLVLSSAKYLAADRFEVLRSKLESLVVEIPGLDETVQMNISGASFQEFITSIAENHKLNLSVDQGIQIQVYNSFSNARIVDVLVFLCRQYNLDIEFTGTILFIKKYVEPVVIQKQPEPKKLNVDYNNQTAFLSLDLKRDTLDLVAQAITRLTYKNIVVAPNVKGSIVSVYIQNRSFESAMDMLAIANGLKITNNGDNFYIIDKADNANSQANNYNGLNNRKPTIIQGLDIKRTDKGFLSIKAENVPIKDIIREVSNEVLINYFVYSEPQGNASLYIENATYDGFLTYLLKGTNYTHKVQENVYLIGERKLESIRETKLITLKYRPVEKIINYIPAELKKDVELIEFIELNGIIVSGSSIRISEITEFLRAVDQVVPMVHIEVIIIDVNKNATTVTGVEAGIGKTPNTTPTNGTVSPGVNIQFSPETINNVINGFNGFGIVNLGNVVPQFYMSLQALEQNGNIKIKSTPRISTLNGNLATLKVGSQEFYLEQTTNLYASNTPQTVVTNNYKSVSADLSVKIKPFVSADGQVTLSITVEQSDFTGKISETAPPGTVSRVFESIIRIKDGDMVILGGLDEKSIQNNSTGLPGVAKIPVLRSIFGKNSRSKKSSQLTIFIKPTVIYQ